MTGKLDEISFQIGQLTSTVGSVAQQITDNRSVADKRHDENRSRLDAIEDTLTPLTLTVAKLTPIVEGIQITRWKMAGAMMVGSLVLAGIGWVITLAAGKITTWALSFVR